MTRMGQIVLSSPEEMMDVFPNSDLKAQKVSQEEDNWK